MIILDCTFTNSKINETLVNKGLIKEGQSVFNNFDDKIFFDFIFFKIEESLPIDNDEYYSSSLSKEDYQSIFMSFNLTEDEIKNQRNYLDAYTFSDELYKKDMTSEYLEEIEGEAYTGSVECFPKFTNHGIIWDISSEDWEEKEYRVYSGITYSQLISFDLNALVELVIDEGINDDIKNAKDFVEVYSGWEDDREYVYDQIWEELEELNSEETQLGRLLQ